MISLATVAEASQEARAFVEEKAEELGEDGAFEAALMEAFVAFDSDDDGRLIGQERCSKRLLKALRRPF